MSLYHHIAGKDALLDGLADWVFTRIDLAGPRQPWRPAMIARAASARARLAAATRGRSASSSRAATPGPALLHHHDAVLGCLRTNGFTVALAAHAFSAIDAYVYGFVLTELNLPLEPGEGAAELRGRDADCRVDRYPHLAEMIDRAGAWAAATTTATSSTSASSSSSTGSRRSWATAELRPVFAAASLRVWTRGLPPRGRLGGVGGSGGRLCAALVMP